MTGSTGVGAHQLCEQLAAVLAAVDRGDLVATDVERAYLRGSVAALRCLSVGVPIPSQRDAGAGPVV